MAKVFYTFRLVCDKLFLTWVLNQPDEAKRNILRKMMFIKSSSKHHPREHIVMLKEELTDQTFAKLISEKLINAENFTGAVKACETPSFLSNEKDIVAKYVKYAVYLSNEIPYRTCIFTSQDGEKIYQSNPHLKHITNTVIVRSEQDALFIIDRFFKEFQIAKGTDMLH